MNPWRSNWQQPQPPQTVWAEFLREYARDWQRLAYAEGWRSYGRILAGEDAGKVWGR